MVPMMTVMPTPGKVPRRMTDPDVITVDHGRESCHGARGARQHGIARESARLQTGRGTSPSALVESKTVCVLCGWRTSCFQAVMMMSDSLWGLQSLGLRKFYAKTTDQNMTISLTPLKQK